MTQRARLWEFFVDAPDVTAVLADLVRALYDGDADQAFDDADFRTREPSEQERWSLNLLHARETRGEERLRRLVGHVTDGINTGAVDMLHDPQHDETPAVDRAALEDRLRLLALAEAVGETTARLFADDFTDPAVFETLVVETLRLVDAAVASGAIAVTADEPWDSCSQCFGYHNVNIDCGED